MNARRKLFVTRIWSEGERVRIVAGAYRELIGTEATIWRNLGRCSSGEVVVTLLPDGARSTIILTEREIEPLRRAA